MAGSKKFFVYTTDAGDDFAILLDESNTEALNAATQDFTATLTLKYTIPGNLSPRFATYASPDGKRSVKCVALTQSIYNGATAGVPTIQDPITPANTLYLVRLTPERIKLLPVGQDTGLDDGDAT